MKKSAPKKKQVKTVKVSHPHHKCGLMCEHSMFVVAGALFVMLGYLYISKTNLFYLGFDLPALAQAIFIP